ncbi:hypothetical protein [Virgibacillus doumboii]|uniref:hypothetical protein n=1 Tax=Virgibacillus doumboii TaxID=2697503 RepID=UPI0013DF1FFC|nr:hypothetical protein [Virgibacillus doumboii]
MESKQSGKEQPLRVVLPELYTFVTEGLEDLHNIHPYDIQLYGVEEETGYQLIFYFGEGYSHQESIFFSHSSIEKKDSEITDFVEKFGESCKEVMIADYFKMMKP